jgi:3-O-methylgallate 3,4-dioxygenase
MARIVLGLGSSHGPTIKTPPERWNTLAAKDMEDPRYSYAELLAMARPGLAAEVTPEKKQERYEALQRGVAAVQGILEEAAPHVSIVLSNPHGVPPLNRMYPVFGIYLGDEESSSSPR